MSSLLSKKSVCVITGPTRGLGRSITLALSEKLPEGSLFILLSRNEQLLEKISTEVTSNDKIHAVFEVFHQDYTNQDLFDSILKKCLDKAEVHLTNFEQAILISNAASLEPVAALDFTRKLDNIEAVASFINGHLVGSTVLISKFLQTFSSLDLKVLVNISSLAAVSPMKSWSLYCMAKAARDMQMKVIGQEESNVRTLNYAPGPLPTDMVETAAVATKDPELKKWFNAGLSNKSLVDCDESAQKLLKILRENTFENGQHIDFYD